MKKLIIILSTIFCAALVIISIYTFIQKPNQNFSSPEECNYIISDYGGKVAVFETDKEEPMVVYEIYTHLLPENDIELLRKGIPVSTVQELQFRLEDLGL